MASRGARNLIVPSRSGPASEAAAEVVRKLEQQQVRVITTKCDLASQDALSKALEEWGKTMPPIRGCINASMALNVSFEHYSPRLQRMPASFLIFVL